MDYEQRSPSPGLRPFVRCFWRMQGRQLSQGEPPDRIVPDGCPEIVINAADVFLRHEGAQVARTQSRALMVGLLTRAIHVAPTGVVDLIGIRFEPAGLYAMTGLPMHAFTNQDVALDQVDCKLLTALTSMSFDDDLATITARLEAKIVRLLVRAERSRERSALASRAAARIAQNTCTIETVACEFGMTRRSLEREFEQKVGITPKRLQRIARFQRAIQEVHGGVTPNWTRTAHRLGFTDQAHFIHDFTQLAGTTPRRYLAEQNAIAEHFYSAVDS